MNHTNPPSITTIKFALYTYQSITHNIQSIHYNP